MDQGTFEQGYLTGWQAVRPLDVPANVPPSPMKVPTAAYMVGVSRGMRDAAATLQNSKLRLVTPT
jgi:hypothetical protein